jgi:hypothetical protein
MTQCTQCEFRTIRSLVLEYADNNLTTALDILNLFLERNIDTVNKAIQELNELEREK